MPAAAMHMDDRWQTSPADWPIDRASLAALKDLGLSDGQVARYFRVEREDVAALRTSFGIIEHARSGRNTPPKRRRFAWRRRG